MSGAPAAASWRSVPVACLTSTFPTTSTTAWMTAMTGVGPAGHLVAGVVYLVPEAGALCDAVTGEAAGGSGAVLVAHPTLFERPRRSGGPTPAGPWSPTPTTARCAASGTRSWRLESGAAGRRRRWRR